MAKAPRIFNLSRKLFLKRNQAERAIENCACAWVDYGKTIRDLTLSESIAARNVQAKLQEPLPQAEIPGLVFEPSNLAQTRRGFALVREAQEFCEANA